MYQTTQAERLALVNKLSENADCFASSFPAFKVHDGQGWVAAVTGVPFEIFNSGIISENRTEAADDIIALFENSKCDGTIKLFGAGQGVASHLLSKGWVPRSASPLMMWKANDSLDDFQLREGLTVELLEHTATNRQMLWDIFVVVYGETPDDFRDAMMKIFLEVPEDHTYALYKDGEVVSIVTAVPQGEYVGIWSMATPPAHQKQGYGAELLKFVMKRHKELGGKDFALGATEAGKVLYDKLGWEVIEHFTSYGIKREEGENPYV